MRKSKRKEKPSERPYGKGIAESAISATNALSGIVDSAYQKIPALPVLERSGTAMLAICLAAYLLFIASIFITAPKVSIETGIHEGKLDRNMDLAIVPGEIYRYEIHSTGSDEAEFVEYAVARREGCGGVMVEKPGDTGSSLCILANGTADGTGSASSNGYGNRSILLFAPWMLSVSDNFSWKVESYASAEGMMMSTELHFTCNETVRIGGREAYKVKIAPYGQGMEPIMILYVDSQKRVLVKTEAGDSEIRLVDAPFPIGWGN